MIGERTKNGLFGAFNLKFILQKAEINGIKCLVPLPESEENFKRLSEFPELWEHKKSRNLLFHRKFFALLKVVFDNQEKYENQEDLLVEIKLKTGHYKEHVTTKGQIIYVPRSIAFENMDQISFELFYDKAIDVVLKHFISGTREEIDRKVLEVLNFS